MLGLYHYIAFGLFGAFAAVDLATRARSFPEVTLWRLKGVGSGSGSDDNPSGDDSGGDGSSGGDDSGGGRGRGRGRGGGDDD